MTQKKPVEAVKERFKNPHLQWLINLLIALVGLYFAYAALSGTSGVGSSPNNSDGTKEIMIYPTTAESVMDFSESAGGRASLRFDGRPEEEVRRFIYLVENKSGRDLGAEDFTPQPIRISVPQDRKILAVLKSSDRARPFRVDEKRGALREEKSSPVDFEPSKVDQHNWTIKPTLLNRGSWFKVEIYTAARVPDDKPGKASTAESPVVEQGGGPDIASEISWVCGIVGATCSAMTSPASVAESPWYLRYGVRLTGRAVYFFVVFTLVNLLLLLLAAVNAKVTRPVSLKEVLLFAFAVVSSLAAAEIMADWVYNNRGPSEQPVVSRVQLFMHAGLFISLAILALARKNKTPPAGPETTAAAPETTAGHPETTPASPEEN